MRFLYDKNRVYEITSGYLEKESFRKYAHKGIDLKMEVGTPLHSPVEGRVSRIADFGNENAGKTLFIETDDHQTLVLGHLSKFNVSEGDTITIGQKIAESGNTGHVVGNGHLHIGLKNPNGEFIDPSLIEQDFQEVTKTVLENGVVDIDNTMSAMGGFREIGQYLRDLKTEGFFMATFDKTPSEFFFGWIGDMLKGGLHFLLENDETFMIIPAVIFMFGTFFVGRNKYTKWIIPLWFMYFVSSILTQTTGLMEWLEE